MQIKIFTLPVFDTERNEEEMNKFFSLRKGKNAYTHLSLYLIQFVFCKKFLINSWKFVLK